MHSMRRKGLLAAVLIVTALAASAGSAHAAVTIGSNLAEPPENNIGFNGVPLATATNLALTNDVAPGGLTSPVNGTVTSWRFADQFSGNTVSLRVLRPGSSATNFTGAGTSPSQVSVTGTNGPFGVSLPIKIDDSVGLNGSIGSGLWSITAFGTGLYWNMPALDDGSSADGTVQAQRELLVQATIEPSSKLQFDAAVLNKKKGTATVTMQVPNPGALTYPPQTAVITGPASVAAPGEVQLTISVAGKARKKLKKKGKVALSPAVTFAPNNGAAATSSTSVTLRKKLKKKKRK